jgi:poly [ADP-ribose] polymerase
MGPAINTDKDYTLNYNEFIVYNTEQIKMRYLAKIKFNFK